MNVFKKEQNNQNDAVFIKKFCTFARYLAIVPLNEKNNAQIVALLALSSIASLAIYSVSTRTELYHRLRFTTLDIALDIIVEIQSYMLSASIIISSNILFRDNWLKLFVTMEEVELFFSNKLTFNKYTKRMYCEIFPGLFILIALISYDNFFYIATESDYSYQEVNYIHFQFSVVFLTIVLALIINIARFTKNRFNSLLNYLQSILKRENIFEIGTIHEIRTIFKIYRKLCILTGECSEIFGWFIFAFIVYYCLLSVYWLNQLFREDLNVLLVIAYVNYPVFVSVSWIYTFTITNY